MSLPDPNIIDLHRLDGEPVVIADLSGDVWLVEEVVSRPTRPAEPGMTIEEGSTLLLAAGSAVEVGPWRLRGGNHGRAHGFVGPNSLRTSPGRVDVPRLIAQLVSIQEEMAGRDEVLAPVAQGPQTVYERAYSAEYARLNLDVERARELEEATARELQAVLLFLADETACVALDQLTVPKLEAVMRAIQRPLNPHLVEAHVITELLDRVYGPS